jgi:hypothetical protein
MYQFSRAIYRELAPHLPAPKSGASPLNGHREVLRACESTVERLATDRFYFAKPARTLFSDIRIHFPMSAQERVYQVVTRYIGLAQQYLAENPVAAYMAVSGKPLQCRATTRKGEACQRMPLPHNGYCPSHQHLAETEHEDLQDRQLAAA